MMAQPLLGQLTNSCHHLSDDEITDLINDFKYKLSYIENGGEDDAEHFDKD